jgi:transcriptional regulator with XRE-family HTH domain
VEPSFAEFLRSRMEELGISESGLARRSGLAQPTVNRILNQAIGPSFRVETLEALAKGLTLSLEDVVRAVVNQNTRRFKDERFKYYAEIFDAPELTYDEWLHLHESFRSSVDSYKLLRDVLFGAYTASQSTMPRRQPPPDHPQLAPPKRFRRRISAGENKEAGEQKTTPSSPLRRRRRNR